MHVHSETPTQMTCSSSSANLGSSSSSIGRSYNPNRCSQSLPRCGGHTEPHWVSNTCSEEPDGSRPFRQRHAKGWGPGMRSPGGYPSSPGRVADPRGRSTVLSGEPTLSWGDTKILPDMPPWERASARPRQGLQCALRVV